MKKKQKHSSKRFHGSWLVLFIVVGLTAAAGASFEYFGHAATTCDQTFSSTTSLQTAVSAAGAAGQTICLTAGSYGSITLSGSHASNVTVEPAPTDSSGNALDPNGGGKVTIAGINITGSFITVHNFYSTGGINFKPPAIHDDADHNDVTNSPGSYGIDIDCNTASSQPGCSFITMNGNRVHGLTSTGGTNGGDGDALRLDGWANATITNNEEYNIEQQPGADQGHTDCLQSYNADVSTHDIVFDHNYEHDNQCQGFFLKDGDVSHNVTVTDNLMVRGSNNGGSDTDIYLYENTDNAIIRNNTAQHTNGSVIAAAGSKSNPAGANVDHNVFDQFNLTPPAYNPFVEDYNIYTDNNQWSFGIGPHSSLNSNPTFMCGSICGNGTKAGDDYRLASNPNGIGIDWAPSQYTYGPESDSGTSPPPDTTPPTVSISAPASGATVSGTTTLSASASDNVGVSSVQFKLDGANLGSADTTSPYSFSWDTTAVGNGSHTLTAVATDTSNNTATSTSVSVTVNNTTADTTPPTTTISSGPASSTTSTSASFSFTGSDNVTPAGSLTFQCSLDGGTYTACTSPKAYSGLSVGTHSFNVKATDAANNTDASPASQSWTITSGTAVTGDLDGDSHVTGHDLSILLSKYGTSYTLGEFDGGSIVEGHDLSILLSNYGR